MPDSKILSLFQEFHSIGGFFLRIVFLQNLSYQKSKIIFQGIMHRCPLGSFWGKWPKPKPLVRSFSGFHRINRKKNPKIPEEIIGCLLVRRIQFLKIAHIFLEMRIHFLTFYLCTKQWDCHSGIFTGADSELRDSDMHWNTSDLFPF